VIGDESEGGDCDEVRVGRALPNFISVSLC